MKSHPYEMPDPLAPVAGARIDELALELETLRSQMRRLEISASESARMYAQARARLRDLSALNKVSRAVISTLDVNEILHIALRQTVQVAEADTGSVMLLDTNTGLLRIVAAHGLSGDVVDESAVPIGEGVAGWVAQHQKPLLVSNVTDDPRFHLVAAREEIRSAMSVPLLTPKSMLGVINVARTSTLQPFTRQELQLLGTMAGQIALAIENARLFEAVNRRNEELSALTSLSAQLSRTLNVREVMDTIVDQACAILHADAGAVFLLDERNDTLRARATRNVGPGFHRRVRGRLGQGIIGEVALTGAPTYVEDINTAPGVDCAELHSGEGLCSMLCVPLSVGGRGIGVLSLYTRACHHWTGDDVSLLMSIAGQGASALQNARNYQDQRGIAELVQRNLMPHMELGREDIEVGHRYLPAKKVGGDYYDLFHLRDGGLAVLMADVAGKSVQAAVHTAKGKYFIRALGYDSPSPADVLCRANALIYTDTAVESFISVFYAVMEPGRAALTFCNAGHPPPLLIHADGSMDELGQPDILLGVLPEPAFTEHTVALRPGDILVLTTDGVTEARSSSAGLYGQDGLRACLTAHAGLHPQALANAIVEDVQKFSDTAVRDDIAVLVLRIP